MRPNPFRRLAPVFALLPLLLAGCSVPAFMSYPPQARGDAVDTDALKQLVPGTSTRADVTAALGTPSLHGTFDDNTWLYVSEVTKPEIGGTLNVLNQNVYVLTFDAKGVLQGIQRKTKADAKPLEMVSRTTPAPGSNSTILQQLLGNVGRFSAGGMPTAGQGSATNPGNF